MDNGHSRGLRNAGTHSTDVPVKDRQTVTPEGERIDPLIEGVRIRAAVTQVDERGTLCEIYDPGWGFTPEPLVHVYQTTIEPGQAKGWVLHRLQDDRLFFSLGRAKVVLYDEREESPTFGMINEHYFSDQRRGLLRIPAGVWHAIQNIGPTEVIFVNCPTRPYVHEDPDKYRLPLDTSAIPYRL
jgi:dTDP-4-dehydrorhamnose 3,5-epimerase